VVEPGDEVKVKILEIDEERRRLSLSLKRVEGQVLERREVPPEEGQEVGDVPDLGLSEEVFAQNGEPAAEVSAETAEPPEVAAADAPPAEAEAEEQPAPAEEQPAEVEVSADAEQSEPKPEDQS
jgi:small subunit ribosomal protein S1